MKAVVRALLAACFCIGLAIPASSQKATQVQANSPKVLTGKERLGPKWTDEQRIDNCNVPAEKRGTTPRPSACATAAPNF